MDRTAAAITQDFDALTAADFDDNDVAANGWTRLRSLCGEARDLGGPACWYTPSKGGPASMSTCSASIRRKPTPLTVWMVNRILNGHPPNAEAWLDLLRNVRHHPTASPTTKTDAEEFLRYQTHT